MGIDDREFEKQTWDMFYEAVHGKKLVLFGVGILTSLLFYKMEDVCIEMVVDNDKGKKDDVLGDYIVEGLCVDQRQKPIRPFSDLYRYKDEDIVILISSRNFYRDMAEQLEREGFHQYYCLEIMQKNQPVQLQAGGETINSQLKNIHIDRCCQYPIEERKLVFCDMGRYAGHGRQITEQLLALRDDLDIVWIVDDMAEETPEGVRKVRSKKALRYFYEMETAGFWVIGDIIPFEVKKREGQIYIHAKHWAGVTLKSFGYEFYEFRNIKDGIEATDHDCKAMDYIIVGSRFDEETCRRCFRFEGPVFYAGSPRSDILFRGEQYKEKICARYHLDMHDKLLLYAPTFRYGVRESNKIDTFQIELDFSRLMSVLNQPGEGEWKILLRLHPILSAQKLIAELPEYVVNVIDYDESEELIAASDIMITDYSSIMFEPAFVYKPVFLFAPDREAYINHERRLLMDYDALPFDIAATNEALCDMVRHFDKEKYRQRLDAFFEKYGVHEDGHAGERAAGFISGLIDKR